MTNRILLLSILVFSLLFSCEDEGKNHPKPDAVSPHITSIEPDSAYIGDIVTIIGTGFGATHDTSKVSFTGVDAIVFTSWGSTEIKVKVPVGVQNGKVSVTVNGIKSNEVDFCLKTNTVQYDIVKTCEQVWMSKNLDVDHYRNGDPIPEVTDPTEWENLKTGAWCYYNNDSAMGNIYGKLYNWYAVNDPRGLAPEGWHVPSDSEWKELEISLGMSRSEAGKMYWRGTGQGSKLAGRTDLWNESDLKRNTNFGLSGFSALPGGWRYYTGTFNVIGSSGYWWSETESDATYAWFRYMSHDYTHIGRHYGYKEFGFSVRCVRD